MVWATGQARWDYYLHGLLALDGEASVGFRGKMAADRRDAVLATQFAGVRLIGIILGIVFATPYRRRGCVCRHFERGQNEANSPMVQFEVARSRRGNVCLLTGTWRLRNQVFIALQASSSSSYIKKAESRRVTLKRNATSFWQLAKATRPWTCSRS